MQILFFVMWFVLGLTFVIYIYIYDLHIVKKRYKTHFNFMHHILYHMWNYWLFAWNFDIWNRHKNCNDAKWNNLKFTSMFLHCVPILNTIDIGCLFLKDFFSFSPPIATSMDMKWQYLFKKKLSFIITPSLLSQYLDMLFCLFMLL